MSEPSLLTEIDPTRSWVRARQASGERVGLVPTMGALHAGHLSLAERSASECDAVLTTIFVNPTQFAPSEDLGRYPRDLDRDLALLATVGVDAVFAPRPDTMYPPGFSTSIDVGPVAQPLEGVRRPTHFAGVATVVAKLLSIAPADRAYFGLKDYQQWCVIRRLVADLDLPVEVVACPIVREPDGLAMSSRNAYLSPADRRRATALFHGLSRAKDLYQASERDAGRLCDAVRSVLRDEAGVEPEYVELVRFGSVEPVAAADDDSVLLTAARIGETRLLDNLQLAPHQPS
ncbi:pantoate--beta-alanine ligase [Botrimarina sp.]|uniref:pantoate--beta-alanine ligase n=1 Tax=Botrimarina sp. TaxID=2795802 RepID=UPI0032F0273C